MQNEKYEHGAALELECEDLSSLSNVTRDEVAGFKCFETSLSPMLHYNVDDNFYCGVEISDHRMYRRVGEMITSYSSWRCKVPVSPKLYGTPAYIPVPFPFWGFFSEEKDRIIIASHVHIVVHSGDGEIHGVSLYPTSEHFQSVKVGGILNFRGVVRWFYRNDFLLLSDMKQFEEIGYEQIPVNGRSSEFDVAAKSCWADSIIFILLSLSIVAGLILQICRKIAGFNVRLKRP